MVTIPTVQELTERFEKSYFARVGDKTRVPLDKVHADARASAVALHGFYQHSLWILNQQTPQTADDEYLKIHAAANGLTKKNAAAAFGTVTVTGNVGGSITAGQTLTFTDGSVYRATESLTLTATSGILSVESVETGTASNRTVGDVLTFAQTIENVNSTATVITLDGGTQDETSAELLERVLFKMQNPSHGGDGEDWVKWCLDVEGVTRAWVSPHESGTGTVTVRIMADNDTDDGIPTSGILERCRAYLETVRPVMSKRFFVVAPEIQTQDFTISITPNTAEVKAAAELELKALLLNKGKPAGKILLSDLNAAVKAATGETDHVIVSPTTDIQAATNKIIGVGTITWQ